ncbi:cation:H+ antiporter [Rugamonas rubra]|uniref:Cation:H+ antiporter n=2 Tax=Rugamonas rubra TaxID=758825 RepID=A0A1I4PK00_9BURK|nr:cation:H+ antiporter [Rugamonas rubra]
MLMVVSAILLAAIGGASFLKGMLAVSSWLRLPKLLVATTIAAFATSGPEMAVSSLAAIAGKPGIGLGDALGSNVVNLGLILGIALLFGPMAICVAQCRRDFMLALIVPPLTFILALDGMLSRVEGMLFLTLFTLWLILVVKQAIGHRRHTPADPAIQSGIARAWILLVVGMAALLVAGKLFVSGASSIALAMGLHPYVIGATVVAVGTSMPELVTVVLARWRGHDDVGLGTILGSNLFNGLAVIGVAATIHPIAVPFGEVAPALAFGVITLLLLFSRRSTISPWRGALLIAAYSAFVLFTAAGAL